MTHFTDTWKKNADVGRFDMCAVVHGHLIGKRLEGQPADVASLKWYQTALNSNGSVLIPIYIPTVKIMNAC